MEVNIPFTITAYMEDDEIKIFGITEIDTTWFGFDAPTKFNAWEVPESIAIEVELIAKESKVIRDLNYQKISKPHEKNNDDYASSILIHDEKE